MKVVCGPYQSSILWDGRAAICGRNIMNCLNQLSESVPVISTFTEINLPEEEGCVIEDLVFSGSETILSSGSRVFVVGGNTDLSLSDSFITEID
jgi:hypothetical protein